MPHPAQIRDAVQVYIEGQYHPVRTWHIQDEITNRLDTRHALVYTALMQLERDGKVCKHVSPESGAEFWFSPSSETFANIQLPYLGHVPGPDRLAAPTPAGRAGGHISRARKAGQHRGRHAVPWLGCGELPALGSGSR